MADATTFDCTVDARPRTPSHLSEEQRERLVDLVGSVSGVVAASTPEQGDLGASVTFTIDVDAGATVEDATRKAEALWGEWAADIGITGWRVTRISVVGPVDDRTEVQIEWPADHKWESTGKLPGIRGESAPSPMGSTGHTLTTRHMRRRGE